MDIEKMLQGKGGYVFVSHSHLDIQGVRKIRNFLEKEGMEPILFYLRCMEGGDEQKLETLKKLIFDEIDAREFFLYVNSENAVASKWVQEELEYIRATRPQRMISIDLNENDGKIENKLSRLIRGMRVFISASARDRELANRLTNTLNAHDFRVYDADASLSVGELWSNSLSRNFESLAEEGCVIALLTGSSLKSQFVRYELQVAVEKNVPILPVLVGETSAILCMEELPMLRNFQLLMVSEVPTDEELEQVAQVALAMQSKLFE
jgi:hypothetical protein